MPDRPGTAESDHREKATSGTYFARLESSKHLLLTTFAEGCLPESATIQGVVDGNRVRFRAWSRSSTVRNIRRTEEVQVAPCSALGLMRLAFPLHAVARLLTGEEASQAAARLAREHPVRHRFLIPALRRMLGWQLVYYELVSYEAAAGSTSDGSAASARIAVRT